MLVRRASERASGKPGATPGSDPFSPGEACTCTAIPTVHNGRKLPDTGLDARQRATVGMPQSELSLAPDLT